MSRPPDRIERVTKFWEDLDPKQRQALLDHPAVKARLGATCELTPRQLEADALLNSAATHCMLFGGSRSGKTFLICRDIAKRSVRAPGSRHAILRFRFSHLHTSIIEDTWPKMMRLCFPNAGGKLDRQLWVYRFDNGSEVWFGGWTRRREPKKSWAPSSPQSSSMNAAKFPSARASSR